MTPAISPPTTSPSLSPPVLYLVDDDRSFLAATARLLRLHGFAVQSFDSAADFLNALDPAMHGCIIADLQMPKMNGLELQDALARGGGGHALPVVFLSGRGDIETSVLAMRHGAEDFIPKRAAKQVLLDAIHRALARDAQAHVLEARLRELRAPFAALTPRDCEVLAHVLRGQLNKQIAADLGIDERSVKRHRTSIMTKLGVDSVVELTRLVHESGLTFEAPGLVPSGSSPASLL